MASTAAKYLVTGGCGFIGSNLAIALKQSGADVLAVDSYLTGTAENLAGTGIEHVIADATDGSLWKQPVVLDTAWDALFHHGDITDPRFGNDREVYEKNVSGFQRVLDLAVKNRCRLIFASTAGLYGNGAVPMEEEQPKDLLTAYGKSKLEMERLAMEASAEIPVVGLRYFNVYGPREAHKGRAASMVFHLYQQMRAGKNPRLFEFGEQKRDFVYVKDVVAANLCALRGPSGIFNVGSGVASEFNDVVAALNTALGTALPIEYFPMPYDPKTYQGNTQADMKRAESVLGFLPKWDLSAGVMDYVRWLDASAIKPVSDNARTV
jgi:ADP-L-glycero-D-manno-heptose 6-epimerase